MASGGLAQAESTSLAGDTRLSRALDPPSPPSDGCVKKTRQLDADCLDIEPPCQCAATLLRYHELNSQWVKLVSRILEVLQAGQRGTSL
jgi:hypothetical protein